jgi:hypothetical protein
MEDSAAMHNQATFLQTRTPSNPSPWRCRPLQQCLLLVIRAWIQLDQWLRTTTVQKTQTQHKSQGAGKCAQS